MGNGHHGEVLVNVQLNAVVVTRKDIDHVRHPHQNMEDVTVLDTPNILFTAIISLVSLMAIGVNGAHMENVQHIVMEVKRKDTVIVTVHRQLTVVKAALDLMSKQPNVMNIDVQSTVNGEHGVDMDLAAKNAVEVYKKRRDLATAQHHNLVVVHVKVLHLINDHVIHKDVKSMVNGDLMDLTVYAHLVVEEVYRRNSDTVTTLPLPMVVEIVRDLQRWLKFVI